MSGRSLGGVQLVLDGAIDMHVHFGPEPLIARVAGVDHAVDPWSAAIEAAEAGMAGIVLKAHEFPSTQAAHLVNARDPHVRVFGGICCDFPVGGLNPVAVEAALAAGAKVVWLPTISSVTRIPMFDQFGFEKLDGLRVIDDEGYISGVVLEIMDLVQQFGAILATGHITRDEHFHVAKEFGSRGNLLVTHAMQHTAPEPSLTRDDCAILADMGAIIEFSAHTCFGAPGGLDKVAKAVQMLKAESVVLSTDYGWNASALHPAPAFRSYLNALYEAGAPADVLQQMTSVNPARLLQIDL